MDNDRFADDLDKLFVALRQADADPGVALALVAGHFQLEHLHWMTLDQKTLAPIASFVHGDTSAEKTYVKDFVPIDPRMERFARSRRTFYRMSDVMTPEELRTHPVLHEFLRPQNAGAQLVHVSRRPRRSVTTTAILRHHDAGEFDNVDAQRLQSVAQTIENALSLREEESRGIEGALQPSGILLDRMGQVIAVEAGAAALLGRDAALDCHKGRLICRQRDDQGMLDRALYRISMNETSHCAAAPTVMTLQTGPNESGLTLKLAALGRAEHNDFFGSHPAAVVTLIRH
ncbi:MAG: hypothetical protein AAFP98_08690 [Pseudomonadota bacterium]